MIHTDIFLSLAGEGFEPLTVFVMCLGPLIPYCSFILSTTQVMGQFLSKNLSVLSEKLVNGLCVAMLFSGRG